MKPPLALLPLLLVAILTGCDSNIVGDDPADDILGEWTSAQQSSFSSSHPLPEWASVDSVRFDYSGLQQFILDIEDVQTGGAVTGTITWEEDATYRATEFRDGEVFYTDADEVADTKSTTIRGVYANSILTVESADEIVLNILFEDAEINFEDGTGSGLIWRPYLSREYVGEGDQAHEVDFTVPYSLSFIR